MELIGLFICLVFSFFFAGFETGFISIDYIKLLYLADYKEDKIFKKIKELYEKKELVIAIVLIGNNITIVLGTIFYNIYLYKILLALNIGKSYYTLITTLSSILFLSPLFFIFGEILPKSIYRTYPYRMVRYSFPLFIVIYYLLYPFGVFFEKLSKLVLKLFDNNNNIDPFFLSPFYKFFVGLTNIYSISKNEIDNILRLNKIHILDIAKEIPKNLIKNHRLSLNEVIKSLDNDNFDYLFIEKQGDIIGYISSEKISNIKDKGVRLINIMEKVEKIEVVKNDNYLPLIKRIITDEELKPLIVNNIYYIDKKVIFKYIFSA